MKSLYRNYAISKAVCQSAAVPIPSPEESGVLIVDSLALIVEERLFCKNFVQVNLGVFQGDVY